MKQETEAQKEIREHEELMKELRKDPIANAACIAHQENMHPRYMALIALKIASGEK
jgi:hypothetical protein